MKPSERRKQPQPEYQVIPYPKYQRLAAAAAQTMRHKPMIHGLLEVDVTGPRAALREHKAKTGELLSFTAFLTTCMAKAVEEHRAVQAFHLGRKRLAVFDDVDIVTRVEREVDGQKVVIPCILRAANRKTFREQHEEIRAAQVADVRDQMQQFRFLPTALFRPFASAIAWIGAFRPRLWKKLIGTVGITSVGMFGSGAGWGIPASAPTALMVTVGGISQKQTIVDGRIVTREYLCLTVSVDHELVDGAPAARFTQRLKELIESGYGLALDAPAAEPEQAMAAAATQRASP